MAENEQGRSGGNDRNKYGNGEKDRQIVKNSGHELTSET